MSSNRIIHGLRMLYAATNPKRFLEDYLKQQNDEKKIQQNHFNTRYNFQKWMAQQPKHLQLPAQPDDHSSRHDASRQYAGSRRK